MIFHLSTRNSIIPYLACSMCFPRGCEGPKVLVGSILRAGSNQCDGCHSFQRPRRCWLRILSIEKKYINKALSANEIGLACMHSFLVSTTLQSTMNAKLSKHRFWHCHENGRIKTIQMIPHNLSVSVKSASHTED